MVVQTHTNSYMRKVWFMRNLRENFFLFVRPSKAPKTSSSRVTLVSMGLLNLGCRKRKIDFKRLPNPLICYVYPGHLFTPLPPITSSNLEPHPWSWPRGWFIWAEILDNGSTRKIFKFRSRSWDRKLIFLLVFATLISALASTKMTQYLSVGRN